MEVHELKDDMDRQFAEVAAQFKGVEGRFEGVDRRLEGVDRRLEGVDRRLEGVDHRLEGVDHRLDAIDRRFEEVIALIVAEGVRTRRHFDVVAEQLISERNLAIDKTLAVDQRVGRLTASNASDHVEFRARLGDHEQRLAELEPKDKP